MVEYMQCTLINDGFNVTKSHAQYAINMIRYVCVWAGRRELTLLVFVIFRIWYVSFKMINENCRNVILSKSTLGINRECHYLQNKRWSKQVYLFMSMPISDGRTHFGSVLQYLFSNIVLQVIYSRGLGILDVMFEKPRELFPKSRESRLEVSPEHYDNRNKFIPCANRKQLRGTINVKSMYPWYVPLT